MPRTQTSASEAVPPPALPAKRAYLEESRDLATGFLFILPLLIGYELGVVWLRSDVINWAHGLIRHALGALGPAEPFLFAAVIASLVVLAQLRADRLLVDAEMFGLMLVESLLYAAAMVIVCSIAAQRMLLVSLGRGSELVSNLVLSAGAGVYEEVLFRVVLMGGLYHGLKRCRGVVAWRAAVIAIVGSSLVFSACHHIGPYGELLAWAPLVYRFGLGVLFAGIYIYRGLGIVVYTHAFYDVFCLISA
ncbi:CPBP family intramembrane metalloprotease [bacterium]|nr:CPBP family intramembrane metalloprotease [bacterium]